MEVRYKIAGLDVARIARTDANLGKRKGDVAVVKVILRVGDVVPKVIREAVIRGRASKFKARVVIEVGTGYTEARRSETRICTGLHHGVDDAQAIARVLRAQAAGIHFNVSDAEIGKVRREKSGHAFGDRNAVELVTVVDVIAAANR